MTIQICLALIIGLAASVDDLARRRINNWIPAAAFVSGVLWQSAASGWRGAVSALLGAAAGFAVFLVIYTLGGMGGGDVKLMAGFGALIGIDHLVAASLWVSGCGALLACGFLAAESLRRLAGRGPAKARRLEAIPYAPAIAVGVWLSLLGA